VDPTKKIRWEDKNVTHDIPGLEHLEKADLVVIFSRLISLPDKQLQHIYKYLDSGKPIIGIRTANHGFLGFNYKKDGKKIDFGEDILGGSFREHHGRWMADSTRGMVVEKNKDHPVLKGVTDVWGLRTRPGTTPCVWYVVGWCSSTAGRPRGESVPGLGTRPWTLLTRWDRFGRSDGP